MSSPSKWDDLLPRIASGAALAAIGLGCIWAGGFWFTTLAVVAAGVMAWELARIIVPEAGADAYLLGLVAGLSVAAARLVPDLAVVPVLMLPAVAWDLTLKRDFKTFGGVTLLIGLAAWGLAEFRMTYGMVWLFWLVGVVIATDIAGYFVGKTLGGAKFWPAISPKKTWSGIIGGWVAAALVGAVFLTFTDAGRDLIWISSVVAFVSQMGDIGESAVKRRYGVKDASNLIPGHGGLMDRFDALLGASLAMLVVALLVDVPEVRF
ncbi:phosphatidate cytidylyltransferase [Frigidibacter sp. ROC022]|uniref:phosphatidate cytidylyltransferase n=1 Tax=Frigidibacter sp. ROC022 TaxID=2971796 RepID=UPI00215AC7E7|nr:phosphatidate cytidylyltransferase [Frigidibacter sp. ROC022]MCR8723835.1 phosphatidate cytidylyltransferase [Frigidibacter sp. ROC022]